MSSAMPLLRKSLEELAKRGAGNAEEA